MGVLYTLILGWRTIQILTEDVKPVRSVGRLYDSGRRYWTNTVVRTDMLL